MNVLAIVTRPADHPAFRQLVGRVVILDGRSGTLNRWGPCCGLVYPVAFVIDGHRFELGVLPESILTPIGLVKLEEKRP